jgi:hypothetical protein
MLEKMLDPHSSAAGHVEQLHQAEAKASVKAHSKTVILSVTP